MRILYAFISSILLFIPICSKAQGCSDAGFCTMGAMKPNQHFHKSLDIRLRSIELTQYIGRDKFDDILFSTILDVNVGINNKNTVQFKLPYTFVKSNLDNSQGLGDISLSFTRSLIGKEKYQVSTTLGLKIPTGKSNVLASDGRPLSMYHQPSLGTFDLVVGASLISKGWLFAAGYQKVLVNNNESSFVRTKWDNHPDPAKVALANTYPVSNLLKRSSDVMFRVEKSFRFSKFNIHIGLLPIYRFNEDKIINPTTGLLTNVAQSSGLALSLISGFTYHFNVKSGIKVLFGDRLIERTRNPDGLSREQVGTVSYYFNF